MTHLNTTALIMVIGTVIPFLTGLVAKERSGAVKAIANAFLTAAAGAITTAVAAHGNVQLSQWLLNMGLAWGASVIAYHGLWNPMGVIDPLVELGAKLLLKVGIKLPAATLVSTEELLTTLFGDLITFVEEWEANHGHSTPTPPTPTPTPTESVPEAGTGTCCGGGCDKKAS